MRSVLGLAALTVTVTHWADALVFLNDGNGGGARWSAPLGAFGHLRPLRCFSGDEIMAWLGSLGEGYPCGEPPS